jgi:hypothetical protein
MRGTTPLSVNCFDHLGDREWSLQTLEDARERAFEKGIHFASQFYWKNPLWSGTCRDGAAGVGGAADYASAVR